MCLHQQAAAAARAPAATIDYRRPLDAHAPEVDFDRGRTWLKAGKAPVFDWKVPVFGSQVPELGLKVPVFCRDVRVLDRKAPVFDSEAPSRRDTW